MPSPRPPTVVVALTLSIFGGGCAAAPAAPPGAPTPASGPLRMRDGPSTPRESPPAPLPGGAPGAGAAPGREKRAALRFDIEGRPFASPLVDVLIAGQPTTLLVDTGATHHVVAQWLASELSLPTKKAGDAGTDHTGRAVAVSRIEDANVSLSGWGKIAAPVLLVIKVPEVLHKLGVGGILSPQALTGDGRGVILDLRLGSMTEATVAEALGRLGTEPGGAPPLSLRVCGGGSADGSQLVAKVTIEGFDAEVKIDSGASHSSLFGGQGVGQKLAGRAGGTSSAYAASGRITVPTVQGAKVKLGTFEGSADIDILPAKTAAAACASDGYIGMDVLRSCVIVLAKDRSAMRCAAR